VRAIVTAEENSSLLVIPDIFNTVNEFNDTRE